MVANRIKVDPPQRMISLRFGSPKVAAFRKTERYATVPKLPLLGRLLPEINCKAHQGVPVVSHER